MERLSASIARDDHVKRGQSIWLRPALWALALFVFSVPSENGVAIAGVGSMSRLMGLLAFGVAVVSMVDRGVVRLRMPSAFVVIGVLFVLWGSATYFWSAVPSVTMSWTVQFAQLLVLAWLIHQVARSERDRDLLMQGFVLGCYLAIAVAVATFVRAPSDVWRDVGGFGVNSFAITSALAIPMAWMLFLRRSFPSLQVLNAMYPLLALVAVVLAASRGGLLTALVALSIIPLTLGRLGVARRILLFTAMVTVAVAAFVWAPQAFPELERNIARLGETGEELFEGTLTGRTRIWAANLEVFASSPIVGVGAGSVRYATEPILGSRRAPHNAFLSVAVGSGVVGLLLFVGLIAVVLVGVLAAPERRIEYIVLLAALLVGMMPSNSDNNKYTWFILGVLASARPITVHATSSFAALRLAVANQVPRPILKRGPRASV